MFKLSGLLKRLLPAAGQNVNPNFFNDVLSDKKRPMKKADLTGIPKIPRIPEINTSLIWSDIKNEEPIIQYFPSFYVLNNRIPDREFMFNVSLSDFSRTLATILRKDA